MEAKVFTATKSFMVLEVVVDGNIDVKPKMPYVYAESTHKVFAATHQITLKRLLLDEYTLEDRCLIVTGYFETKGWMVNELQ